MTEAFSQQQPSDLANEYATIQFIIQSILSRVATATLVRVVSCTNDGGLAPWGTVNVQPVISQLSGNNVAVQHGNLFRLPYLRIQGGTNAIIMDPVVGDLGLAVFCARDISSMKDAGNIINVKSGSVLGVPPASGRQYSMADGVFIGGMLNSVPVQYVQFSDDGITVHSPTKVTVNAPDVEVISTGTVNIQSADTVTIDASAVDIGDVTTIDGKPFLSHTHSGVTPGGGITGGVT